MINTNKVKWWYSLFNASWYKPFRAFWSVVSKKNEIKFVKLIKENIHKNSRILELGCGTGINIERIKNMKFKEYVGYDFSESMLDIAKKKFGKISNVKLIEKDITKVDDNKEKFDLIISSFVISHLSKPSGVINKYYGKLNKKGKIILIFLTKPKQYINLWIGPILRLFSSSYVLESEIKKIKNKKKVIKSMFGLCTIISIEKGDN